MTSECCRLAAEGWRIISQNSESRKCARELIRWLAETFDVNSAEFRFQNSRTSYRWKETVERISSGRRYKGSSENWNRQFPSGMSSWHFEGFDGDRNTLGPLLDLLAEQWLRLNDPAKTPGAERPIQNLNPGTNKVNPAWIAVSRSARLIKSRLHQLSHSMCPLLILGEVGTGKSYMASLIHRTGPTPILPFTRVHSSELAGTLFVPDWRNIEEDRRRVLLTDPRRLIAAADEDSSLEMIRKSWDLETGGSGSILTIPPLRERKADIPMLAGRFVEIFVSDSGFPLPELAPTALEALKAYPWPGNIRELKESISWAMERCNSTYIDVGDLPPAVRGALRKQHVPSFSARLVALESEVLKEELTRQQGNITRTAKALGLTPRQVSWRVRKYCIDPGEFKSKQQTGA